MKFGILVGRCKKNYVYIKDEILFYFIHYFVINHLYQEKQLSRKLVVKMKVSVLHLRSASASVKN